MTRTLLHSLRVGLGVLVLLWATSVQAGFIDHLATTDDIGPAKVPHVGHSHLLVIPVNLDAGQRKPLNVERIRRFFTDKPGVHRLSFPGYYRIASGGRFTVSATVAEAVNVEGCPFTRRESGCTPSRGDVTALVNGVPFIRSLITRAFAESKLDPKTFDINGPDGKPDGYADGVLLIFNGGWFGVALPFGLMRPEWTLEFDGVKITMAALSSGRRAQAMSLHEFGHLLGLADLYDEWRTTFGMPLSLMGAWQYRGDSVPLPNAFSRMRLGWAEVEQLEGTRRVRLDAAARGGTIYRLGHGREYFLVENRAPAGIYDRESGGPGLVVIHVNLDRQPGAQPNDFYRTVVDCPNCRRFRPYLMLVQADGRYDLQWKTRGFEPADLFHTGDAFLPRPQQLRLSPANIWSGSNVYAGFATGIAITQVDSDSAAPAVVATLTGPRVKNACKAMRCPPESDCRSGRCVRRYPKHDLRARVELTPEPAFARADAPELDAAPADDSPRTIADEPAALPDWLDWRALSLLLLVAWVLVIRRMLKRRLEAHMRKRGELGEDENLKNRF